MPVLSHLITPATPIPAEWVDFVRARTGRPNPVTVMTDGRHPVPRSWADGYDPDHPVDRAIMATRHFVFPWHGMDPRP